MENQNDEDDEKNMFEVLVGKYGRSCYATRNIKRGETILTLETPSCFIAKEETKFIVCGICGCFQTNKKLFRKCSNCNEVAICKHHDLEEEDNKHKNFCNKLKLFSKNSILNPLIYTQSKMVIKFLSEFNEQDQFAFNELEANDKVDINSIEERNDAINLISQIFIDKFSIEEVKKVYLLQLTNQFLITTFINNKSFEYGFALYPKASFFNHSCLPNVARKKPIGFTKRNKNRHLLSLEFVALNDIEIGEEIFIRYCEGTKYEIENWNFGFKCSCTRCSREEDNEMYEKSQFSCPKGKFCSGLLISKNEQQVLEDKVIFQCNTCCTEYSLNELNKKQRLALEEILYKNIQAEQEESNEI